MAARRSNPWTHPGLLRIGFSFEPSSLNPMLSATIPAIDLSMFVFSYAVRFDDRARPVPDALSEVPTVQNGDVTKDGRTLIYRLRHNVKWQDGQPLTCADLKFTWQVVMNPSTNAVSTEGYRDIRDIDCSNPYVAVVHMKRLYAPYIQELWSSDSNVPILPQHILVKYNDKNGSINHASYNAKPVGSGPFQVVEWIRGSHIRLHANPNYFLGKPKLNDILISFIPNENTMETQIRSHEIDLMANGTGVNWPRYARLAAEKKNGVTAMPVDSLTFDNIVFNTRSAILSDRRVRIALAYALNKREIVAKIYHGAAFIAQTDDHPRYSWAYNGNLVGPRYDLQRAKNILNSAGWKPGPDGIRTKNGRRLEFTFTAAAESTLSRAVQTLVQQQWREAGVQADVKNFDATALFANGNAGIIASGRYDAAIYGYGSAPDPDDSTLYSSEDLAPRGQNVSLWENARATQALRDGLNTLDLNRRKRDYTVVQEELLKDVPVIIIAYRKDIYVFNKDLQNFYPSPVVAFWNAWAYAI
jgi:peptide/nickel transport system substrate-binding protein